MATDPADRRQTTRFLLLYALAVAGGAIAYVPFLTILIVLLAIMVVVSLIRGIVAFLKTTKVDLENNTSETVSEMQLMQNKAMFDRIKYQGLAILVVAILLAVSQ